MNPTTFKAKAPGLMRQFMADFDCTKEDAAAVFGNAGHESGGFMLMQEIRPTVAGSRGGFGWFQWTGPRRRKFEAYCERNGLDPTSDKANYAYLVVELRGEESGAIPALKRAKEVRDDAGQVVKSALRAKVEAFEQGYERAGVKHYASREQWARIALDAFKAKYGNGLAPVKKTGSNGGAVVAGGTAGAGAGAAAQQAGLPPWAVALIIAGVMIAGFLIWKFKR